MTFEDILYEVRNGVAWIIINRPDKMNAFRGTTCDELIKALYKAGYDRAVGAVVLAGAGDKAFCTGGDQSAHDGAYDGRGTIGLPMEELHAAIRDVPKPVIARVQGFAIGGGNVLATICDLTICSEKAVFGQVGPKVGSSPFFGGTNLLALTVGEKKTREVIYMCKQYTAQEAVDLGMINKVVPHAELHKEVQEWCETLLDRSPTYLEMTKMGANCWFEMLQPSFEMAKQAMIQIAGNAEQTEGATAFMEKRKPNFRQFRKAED